MKTELFLNIILLKDIPPQNDNFLIFHLPPCRSEPIKALFVFGNTI